MSSHRRFNKWQRISLRASALRKSPTRHYQSSTSPQEERNRLVWDLGVPWDVEADSLCVWSCLWRQYNSRQTRIWVTQKSPVGESYCFAPKDMCLPLPFSSICFSTVLLPRFPFLPSRNATLCMYRFTWACGLASSSKPVDACRWTMRCHFWYLLCACFLTATLIYFDLRAQHFCTGCTASNQLEKQCCVKIAIHSNIPYYATLIPQQQYKNNNICNNH